MGGQLNLGESANAAESANALIAINALLDSWRNEGLMCYAMQDETVPLASGNTTRTVGPTGNLATTRPVFIKQAYIVYGSTSIPIRVIESEEYAAISDKTATSTYPTRIYYQPLMPDGKIWLYPLPSASSDLHVLTEAAVTAFAAVSTTVSLPPGWEDALTSNLCVYMAPEWEWEPSNTVIGMARNSKRSIKKINTRPVNAVNEVALLTRHSRQNIVTGV